MNESEQKPEHEENEQYRIDSELLAKIKNCVPDDIFAEVEFQLEESENPHNYRIVDEPIGAIQNEGAYNIWLVQTGGEVGDNYSGTVSIELSIGKYLMWNFWM